MEWKPSCAKNGQETLELLNYGLKVNIHSTYNPEKEAERWAQRYLSIEKTVKKIFVLGMGLGYHIKALQSKFPKIPIEVWDFNNRYKQWIVNQSSVQELLNTNVIYKSSENLKEINEQFFEQIKTSNTELIIHKASLFVIPEHLNFLREKLEDINFVKDSVLDKQELLKCNFTKNTRLRDEQVSTALNKYQNNPFLLVSAGPSLNKQLPLIKHMRETSNIVIGCVGTALKPLLLEGIVPDFLMVSDPLDNIHKQIEDVDTKDLTLFYLSTANHKTVSSFKGKRYIVWQEAYTSAKKEADIRHQITVETGGSVATSLLDLMVKMGASKIAFVGQDLAYTNGQSHSSTATGYRKVMNETTVYSIENFHETGQVPTSKNLMIYLRWFESYIPKNRHVEFYNCTEGGAFIKGCSHIPLKKFFEIIHE